MTFLQGGTQTLNSCRSLDYACGNGSSIYFNDQYKIYIMLGKSKKIPQQSTQNKANLPLRTCEKNQWTCFIYNTGVNFSSRNNFANLGSFAKPSVPVQSITFGVHIIQRSESCLLSINNTSEQTTPTRTHNHVILQHLICWLCLFSHGNNIRIKR